MVSIFEKQILIDGNPVLVMAGEIHYYRLDVSVWEERILQLKETGANAVATYVPWLIHEEEEGTIDLTGETSPELNLVHFIDLCAKHGLYFILRPGPFVMAEMKNDGIPYWVHNKYPEVIPTTWDENQVTTVTLDYLSPNFLVAAKKWLTKVYEIATPRLQPNGGNIIAVQLDNEIGMLSWVSNCPDLTSVVLTDLQNWLKEQYGETVTERYEFIDAKPEVFKQAIISPDETYSLELLKDLGYYMRYRFAKYVAILRKFSEECGVLDVLFLINIHGTSAGRGFLFPIGISQLYETYQQQPDYVSGSDIYLDDLTTATYQDLYVINAYMDAMHNENQPLTSLEFACGSGDYGETYGGRLDVSSVDLKARMCMAQGFKMLNYYLFSGGYNKRLAHALADGNERIATTGERHGFAAPISPEGKKNYTFDRMSESIQTIMANSTQLATMTEEHDDLVLGFIPDYFMTEYHYPKSQKMRTVIENIQKNRAYGSWEIAVKAIMLNNFRFTATDLQNKEIPNKKVLVVTAAKYMAANIQQKIVTYLENGGKVFLYGEFPEFDMEGNRCEILKSALKIQKITNVHAKQEYFLSTYGVGIGTEQPEVRIGFAQTHVGEELEAILKIYGTDETCCFFTKVGEGSIIVMTNEYRADKVLMAKMLEQLGMVPEISHNHEYEGLFISTSANAVSKYYHVLNLDGFDKTFDIFVQNQRLFESSITVRAKHGIMIPINIQILENVKIVKATTEIVEVQADRFSVRLNADNDYLVLDSTVEIAPSSLYRIEKKADYTYIYSQTHGVMTPTLTIKLK
ncbi:MAG: beta-galactosidase [Culicoidibacterales bacterium]